MAAAAPESLRVVLFTDMPPIVGGYAQLLAANGHRLLTVVTSRKRNFGYLEVVKNVPASVDIIVSDRPRRWAGMLAPLRPDIIISTVFPWRIPQNVLNLPRFGAFNVHPSLLPKYRGTMTPNWTFLNGEKTAGLTAHRMVADFDAGPILAQVALDITDEDDIPSYMQRLFAQAPAVVMTAIQKMVAGDPGEPQDESVATYFGQIPAEQRVIDWNSSARRIHNQVRAFGAIYSPPGAYGTVEGVPSRILRSRLLASEGVPADVEPGTVIERTADGLIVQCGDGPILVVAHEPETPPQPLS
jgi:methionyl-tRNA formyltransferase